MWRLRGRNAAWQSKLLHASVDLQRPERGLTDLLLMDHRLTSTMLLGVEAAAAGGDLQLADGYTRGDDLVAQYRSTSFPFQLEVYWRVHLVPEPLVNAVMLETLVSVQTELLDCDPTARVESCLPAESVEVYSELGQVEPEVRVATEFSMPTQMPVGLAGSAFAIHFQQAPFVFAQWFAGADVCQATLSSDSPGGHLESAVTFFHGRVEKGVIRRARLQAMLGDGSGMPRLLHDGWSGMLGAPPPLTT